MLDDLFSAIAGSLAEEGPDGSRRGFKRIGLISFSIGALFFIVHLLQDLLGLGLERPLVLMNIVVLAGFSVALSAFLFTVLSFFRWNHARKSKK